MHRGILICVPVVGCLDNEFQQRVQDVEIIIKQKQNSLLDKQKSENNFNVKIYGGNANLFLPSDCSDLFNVENYSQYVKNLDLKNLRTDNVQYTTNMFKNLTSLQTINLSNWNQTFDINLSDSKNLMALNLPSSFSGDVAINLTNTSWKVFKNNEVFDFIGKNTEEIKGGLVCKKFNITIQNYGEGEEPSQMLYLANGQENKIEITYVPQKAHYNFDGWNIKINTQNKLCTIENNIITIPVGASGDIVISPKFEPIYHTVKFYSYDGLSLLKEQNVQENTNIVYGGSLPKIAEDEMWHYEFDVWVTEPNGDEVANLNNIMQSVNLYAKYKRAINTYEILVKSKEQNGEYKTADLLNDQNICEGIKVTPSYNEKEVEYGKSVTLEISTKYNYKILNVKLNGQEIKLNKNIIEINNINKNIEIKIEYKKLSFFVTTPAIIIYSVIFAGIICLFILYLLKNKKIIKFNLKNKEK